jgi:hypothetical protein
MKAVGNCREHQSNQVKSIPQHQKSQCALGRQHKAADPWHGLFFTTVGQGPKAPGAQHASVVLGDTLPAEEPLAIRATRHGFTVPVMITSLIGKFIHIPLPKMVIATMKFFKQHRSWFIPRILPVDTM